MDPELADFLTLLDFGATLPAEHPAQADHLVDLLTAYVHKYIDIHETSKVEASSDILPSMPKKAIRQDPQKRAKVLKSQPITFEEAVRRFGVTMKKKLSNPAVSGQAEDQLKSPIERLLMDSAGLVFPEAKFAAVGETPLPEIKTRPDFSITLDGLLVGYVELKAPGKGSDPRRFKGHDKQQWNHLKSLPNLLYTDGNSFGLWRDGELVREIVKLDGEVHSAGASLRAPDTFPTLITDFLQWNPVTPKDAEELAQVSARLCRLLRDEVVEQLNQKAPALTKLKDDWCYLLFPDAKDPEFADGYAQTVTFGMLVARSQDIEIANDLDRAAQKLGATLIGTALRVLTFGGRDELFTIRTLQRVLDAVDWSEISKGDPDAWLYFYEDFLSVYDNKLRKLTGSYYTPAPVVTEMVRLVDEVLQTRFGLIDGLGSETVAIADPAVGTGTFLLGILRRIAASVREEQGEGAVPASIDDVVRRLIAFEIQLGPFAVAQLRILAELRELIGADPAHKLRMFVTDTLADPYVEQKWLPAMLEPIAESRKQANHIKAEERIMVVIGNPPYKEKAKGKGGWIEDGGGSKDGTRPAVPPLDLWQPPKEWKLGTHAKHLRNKYIYFWRWATWKVFDQMPNDNSGIICFISVAGFLNGPGFEKMRDYLRRVTDEIWVIDCSPEGHQPEVATRIFEGVQHPICIVLACRSPKTNPDVPAKVRYQSLPSGKREDKFRALGAVRLEGVGWKMCSEEWRAPFLEEATGEWGSYLQLESAFLYGGSGVMPGRTWVIAPSADSLCRRWEALTAASGSEQEDLFRPHLVKGKPGDKHCQKPSPKQLLGCVGRELPIVEDTGACVPPVRYGFRSLDRQWIIPDNRLINRPNPQLWGGHSKNQVYLTALTRHSPTSGPALTATGDIPDLHHYKGSFGGRVFPLWLDSECTRANVNSRLLGYLSRRYGKTVTAENFFAYIAAVAASPDYTVRFQRDLKQPGLRIPLTANYELFLQGVKLGESALWLHTFGQRFFDPSNGRPRRCPRLDSSVRPTVPKNGAISSAPEDMPNELSYSPEDKCLHIGTGFIENVTEAMMSYEVSGTQVVKHWFSYRKKDRSRPVIGDRRPPSELNKIQANHWLPEYTKELLEVLNVLGLLIDLEPKQKYFLDRVCAATTITLHEVEMANALSTDGLSTKPSAPPNPRQSQLPTM